MMDVEAQELGIESRLWHIFSMDKTISKFYF